MTTHKLFIRRDRSKVFALCQTPKGIYILGEYRSKVKAKARCDQMLAVMKDAIYVGFFQIHEWKRERRVLSGKEAY